MDVKRACVERGREWLEYERQMVEHYRRAHPDHRAWLWPDVPEDILTDMGWLTDFTAHRRRKNEYGLANTYMEFGLDGAVDCADGAFIGLQAKNRTIVDGNDLGTFQTVVKVMRDQYARNSGLLYHSGHVTPAVHYSSTVFGFGLVYLPLVVSIPSIPSIIPSLLPPVVLRPYQHDAVNNIMAWFSDSLSTSMTVLAMPPGTGKTEIIRALIESIESIESIGSIDTRRIVILSETIALNAQTAARVRGSLMDCEHARSLPDDHIICCTYDSAALLIDSAIDLLIVDEAHNLNFDSDAGRLAQSCPRVLMVSGTPPTSFGDMDDLPIVYNMSLREAIVAGIVCDYEVLLPVAVDTDTSLAWHTDDDFLQRAAFLSTVIERCGIRACIVYVNRIRDADTVIRAVQRECQSHGRPFYGAAITCDTPSAVRNVRLARFDAAEYNGEFRLLVAVRILDEGIDMPAADAVFFAEPPEHIHNARRQVQRLCRANRKDPRNPYKIARALIWSDISSLTDLLMALKEYDPELSNRVRCISNTYEPRMSREMELRHTVSAQKCAINVRTLCLVPRLEKIQFMIQQYGHVPPTKKAVMDTVPWYTDSWKVGIFVSKLRRANKSQGHCTPLSDQERDVLNNASLYYLTPPDRMHMIQFMIQKYGHVPPTMKAVMDSVPWSTETWQVGTFLNTLRRANKGQSTCTPITDHERDVLNNASLYYLTPPDRMHKIQFMIQKYGNVPPTCKAVMDSVPWDTETWRVGTFLTTLRGANKSQGHYTPLTDHERDVLNNASMLYLNP